MATLSPATFWGAASEAFSNRSLELTILPTEQCNLRCVYCYERFELGRMKRPTIDAVKALLARRAGELKRLRVDWFGGEPLLAPDVIEEIGSFATEMAAANPGLDYQGSGTTNGVLLTPDLARRMARVGLRQYQVSLDGPEAVHDRSRKLRGGQGTFAKIRRNLEGIRDSDVPIKIDLRIHVTPENIDTLDGLLDDLAAWFLPDRRFTVYFFPIVDLGGPNSGKFSIIEQANSAATVRRLSARVRELSPPPEAPSQPGAGASDCYVCYAAKPNAWVIRSNGRLSKCTVAFEDERNHVGWLRADGTLDVTDEKLRIWLRGWESADRMTLHCPLEELRANESGGGVCAPGT